VTLWELGDRKIKINLENDDYMVYPGSKPAGKMFFVDTSSFLLFDFVSSEGHSEQIYERS